MESAGSGEKGREITKAPALCSQRWNLTSLAFFGFLFVYVVRVNLSVAIICMVRAPPRANHSTGNYTTTATTTATAPELMESLPRGYSVQEKLDDFNETLLFGLKGFSVSVAGEPSTRRPPEEAGKAEDELSRGDGAEMVEEEEVRESHCGDDGLSPSGSGFNLPKYQTGEFDWDKATRSRILAMYFYGYIFTQIPGGWLAGRYGGRRVWGLCQSVSALCALLTPLAARSNVNLVYFLRFLIGLAHGVSFPCFHAMLGRWAPKLERSKLAASAFAGPPIATILAFSLSALLCQYGFDNGWGSIFYLAGAGNVLWVITWFVFTADTPSQSKRISLLERDYILESIGERPDTKAKTSTPWRAMFTSGPLWAIICAHFCNNYTNYTMLTSLPTFMKEVLHFDIKENGALSALPYLCQALVSVASGQIADRLRERGILSTKNTRKVLQVVSFLGTAVCVGSAGFITCEQRHLAVLTICLCLSFMGLNRSGYCVNHIDLAPRHAGVLFGITNTVATIPGMIAPLVAGILTPNRTREEWRTVFLICSGIALFGAVVFGLMADGELQVWSSPTPDEASVDVTRDVSTEQEKTTENESSEEKITLDVLTPESTEKEDMETNVDSSGVPLDVIDEKKAD